MKFSDPSVGPALPSVTAKAKSIQPFTKVVVVAAEYVSGYKLRVKFSDGKVVLIDFYERFLKLRGYCSKYQQLSNFKGFRIANGNVVWGDYSDVAFPVSLLYTGQLDNISNQ